MDKLRNASRIFALAALAMAMSLRAQLTRGASDPGLTGANAQNPMEPLCDLDTSFLSVNIQMPWGEDPFLKVPGYAHTKPAEESLALDGIVYSRAEPMAIINGESVLVGDRIGGRTVQSIGQNYVVLKKGDSLRELVLSPIPPDESDDGSDDESDEEAE